MANVHRERTQDELIAFTASLTAVLTAMAVAERKTGRKVWPSRPVAPLETAILPVDVVDEESEWTRLRARAEGKLTEARMARTAVLPR